MSINIELEPEQIDVIMVQELTRQIEDFEENITNGGLAIFDDDQAKDAVHMQEYISALTLVRSWYTV